MLTKTDLQEIQKIVNPPAKDIKDVKKRVGKIEKTVNLIVKNYDEGDAMLTRRIKKLEQHVGLPNQN
jgi:predicted RND superfamily exporter protein